MFPTGLAGLNLGGVGNTNHHNKIGTTTMTATTATGYEACTFCKEVGPMDYWLPEKYRADN